MERDVAVQDIAEDKFRVTIQGVAVAAPRVHVHPHDIAGLHHGFTGRLRDLHSVHGNATRARGLAAKNSPRRNLAPHFPFAAHAHRGILQ